MDEELKELVEDISDHMRHKGITPLAECVIKEVMENYFEMKQEEE